ncbi:MAG: hypothetical protein AAF721_23145 [Myxococcota bacterium]
MATTTLHAARLFIASALLLGGCAHSSFYRSSNNDLVPEAVAAEDVKVFKQKDDVADEYVELGLFRGSAPTVDEAMDKAKQTCGDAGASMYILNTPPFKSGKSYRVDGVCAAAPDAPPRKAGSTGKDI